MGAKAEINKLNCEIVFRNCLHRFSEAMNEENEGLDAEYMLESRIWRRLSMKMTKKQSEKQETNRNNRRNSQRQEITLTAKTKQTPKHELPPNKNEEDMK